MNLIYLFFLLITFIAKPFASGKVNDATVQCEELNKKTTETLTRMGDALKIKTGYLLGEMETSKQALDGCVNQNKAVETRASLFWFLTNGLLIVIGTLIFLHQRKMKRAVLTLNKAIKLHALSHDEKYLPSQWNYRILVAMVCISLLLTNFVGLFV